MEISFSLLYNIAIAMDAFEKAVYAYMQPAVLSANPSSVRRRQFKNTPSLLKEDTIQLYMEPEHQFNLTYMSNFISQDPLKISENYDINYITMAVRPSSTIEEGHIIPGVSITVRVSVRDHQGFKNVLLNHVVSANPKNTKVHILYDTTIPIHNETYRRLKFLLIKIWMDTRSFLYEKSLHASPKNTRLYSFIRDYIDALPLPNPQKERLIQSLFNDDATMIPVMEEKMLTDSYRPDISKKEYVNYLEFLMEKEETKGGRKKAKVKKT